MFLALISGLPYAAQHDKTSGRLIWFWHSNVNNGPRYIIKRAEAPRLLEEVGPEPEPNLQPQGHLWVRGFVCKPTHWMPLPAPPKEPER